MILNMKKDDTKQFPHGAESDDVDNNVSNFAETTVESKLVYDHNHDHDQPINKNFEYCEK